MSIVVKLDNPEYPGNGGTVVAVVETVAEYLAIIRDRDGAHDRRYRLWSGTGNVGDRVMLPRVLAGPYSEYSPAQECAMRLQRDGVRSIRIDRNAFGWFVAGT